MILDTKEGIVPYCAQGLVFPKNVHINQAGGPSPADDRAFGNQPVTLDRTDIVQAPMKGDISSPVCAAGASAGRGPRLPDQPGKSGQET